jgi:zinc transport system ATP-binding protein
MTEPNNYFLKVSNLEVKLQNKTILENVSFPVKRGTMLAIVGPNGAGKTMLFRALLDLVPHTGGVEWAEKPRIGYVPQDVNVKDVPVSVNEFLSYRQKVDVRQLLAAVKLGRDIANETLGNLSGGQLRRVLVAFALMDDPNVLLFDEPTTGVDIGGEESIFQVLKNLKEKRGITVLLITHDVHLVKEYTDELLGLNRCVTFLGDSQQIADPSLQERIFGERICYAL